MWTNRAGEERAFRDSLDPPVGIAALCERRFNAPPPS
jgi:hypothetical protein